MTRTDRFTEALETMCDLSRSDREAQLAYLRRTRGLKPQDRAFGFGFGLDMRERKAARRQDDCALQRWEDEGGR